MTMKFFGQDNHARLNSGLAKEQADLDWEVLERKIYSYNREIKSHKALWRSDNDEFLSVVSKGYHPYQNTRMMSWVDFLLHEHNAEILSAGHFNSKKVYVQLELMNQEREIKKDDLIKPFFLISNSHDGSLALKFTFTIVRVICQNTLVIAQKNQGNEDIQRVFRHTASIEESAEELKELFDLSTNTFNQSMEVFGEFTKKELSMSAFNEYVSKVFQRPLDELDKFQSMSKLTNAFEYGMGNEGVTLWDGFNAITEFTAHHQRAKNEETRANSNWFGAGARVRNRAFEEAVKLLEV